jgi:hypothetical protein
MPELPHQLSCGLDSHTDYTPEDYTDWQITTEESDRLDEYQRTDVNTDEDWSLQGGDEKWPQPNHPER